MLKFISSWMLVFSVIGLASCSSNESAPDATNVGVGGAAAEVVPRDAQEDKNPLIHILGEHEARRLATNFLNESLSKRKFLAPGGEIEFPPIEGERWEGIVYDYRKRRIVLRFGGYGGWEASVSLGSDGSDPMVEHAEFAWD